MKTFLKILIPFIFLSMTVTMLYSWGFWGHQRINRMAVFAVHTEMFGFFKNYIDFLTIHSVDPDKRRYAMEGEAACHYIDIDRYGDHPFDSIPVKWKDAVAKYSEDTLMAHGIVPWHIEKMTWRLTGAFREKNLKKILKYAAELGHYIGDAHVPLHCTQNYNGQLTGQHGIHGLWESRIPELLGEDYDYFTGKCRYVRSPLEEAWRIVHDSYQAHDSVLTFEKKLTRSFREDRKYAYEQKGNMTVKVYSREYTEAYDRMLGGMAERRMREAILMVASYWYTAWVNAGQPDLNELVNGTVADSIEKEMQAEEAGWMKKIFKGGGHED